MQLSRRGFVLAGGVAMAGFLAGCGGGGAFAPSGLDIAGTPSGIPDATADDALGSLTLEHFDRIVGDTVRMSDGEHTVDVTVSETIDHQDLNDENPALGTREPFSVVFEGPADFSPREGRYQLTHPDFGTVEVFMCWMGSREQTTVVGSTVETNRYELHLN